MRKIAYRRTAGIVGACAAVTLVAAGCSSNDDSASDTTASVSAAQTTATGATGADSESVELKAADGSTVTLTGPIAAKYSAATEAQKTDLGAPRTGDDAAGTSDSGVVYQQFEGGVITAKNAEPGTPAYITWGKIRDAWNVERDASGAPSDDGEEGSDGPLGAATSDETDDGDLKVSTFEHGKITFDTKTGAVVVTVNGKEVPTN